MNDLFPKFVITSAMLSLVAAICERLGQLHGAFRRDLRLRRIKVCQFEYSPYGSVLFGVSFGADSIEMYGYIERKD